MQSLPPRLDGFFIAIIATSNGIYDQGGLCVTFPAEFDRQPTDTGWSSTMLGSSRADAHFKKVERNQVASFFANALCFNNEKPESYRVLVDELSNLLLSELGAKLLEFWLCDEGGIQTLCICLKSGNNEQWLQLFWSMD